MLTGPPPKFHGTRDILWRNAPRVVCAVVLAFMLLGAGMFNALFSAFGETRYPSPDGRSVLVVTEGADVIDPLWNLSVRQPSTFVARTWEVGCFNGDDPDNSLVSVAWISPTQIEAVAESGNRYLITVDPSDARPSQTISVGCDD